MSRTIDASEGNPFLPTGVTYEAGTQGIFRISTVPSTFGSPATLATPITGYTTPTTATPRQSIIGSDYRTSNGLLYALGYTPPSNATLPGSAQLYTLAPTTGVLTPVGTAQSLILGTNITHIGFDFNPVEDLIRVVGLSGKNYRLNPATGAIASIDTDVAYAATDTRAGITPGIGTVAYTNAYIGATTTQLYDIDEVNGAILVGQNPPNAGTLNSIAPITNPPSFVNFSVAQGLDIDISHISGADVAYLIEVSDPDLRPTVTVFGTTIPNPNYGAAASNLQILNLTDGTVTNRTNVIPARNLTPFNIYDIAVPMPNPLISVRQGILTLANGATYSGFPNTQVGSTSAPVTFTISNASTTDPLTISGISTTGEFALSGTAPTTVAPGGSATFDLTFTPTVAGTRTGTVSIANNSPGNTPYVINLSGVGVAPNPLISVSQGATTYANGSTYSGFPTTAQGSTSSPVTFTITNSSTTDALTIGGITTTGDFALSGAAPTTVAPGASATFNLTFTPTAGGTRTGTVSIANNSQTNNPYVINLSGQSPVNPLIAVSQAGTPVANGSTFSGFATTTQGSSSTLTFTITNASATDALTLGAFTVTGPFAVSGTAPTNVPANSTATFDLTFTPTAIGLNTGSVSIANNSQANNPYVITLNGQGTAAAPVDLVVSTTQNVTGTYRNVTILGPNTVGGTSSSGIANLTGSLSYSGALVVQPGGVLLQNCQSITGSGSFELQAGAAIAICDPAGIVAGTALSGAVQVTGGRSFSPDASYLYNNNTNTPQVTGSGLPSQVLNLGVLNTGNVTLSQAVGVKQVLRLQAGNLNTGGQTLTLLSSSAGTALVDNTGTIGIGGVVNGTATVQRYITPNLNGGLGYRHYSSPVQSTTVADLTTTGFTPVVNPLYNTQGNSVTLFPTVYSYDQSFVNVSTGAANADFDKGWRSPNTTGDVLVPTLGYTVNITASANVDFVGTLNNLTLPTGSLLRGSQTMSGYHLRGNPYPSPLNWSSILSNNRAPGIENALYVFKSSGQYSGTYTSFVNGQSTNTGTNILPLGQGFLVRTAPGQTGSITFDNVDRITTFDPTPFQRGARDTRTQLTIALGNASVRTQAVVYFEAGATAAFDAAFDAHTLPAPNGLLLATETPAAEPLSINGLPLLTATDVLVPLEVATAAAGTYTLSVDNLTNLPANYHAYLRDALTGTYTDLATTPSLSLTMAASGPPSGRYALLFTTQARVLATAPAALAKLASVYPNPAHGTATLLLPVALRGTQATTVAIVDNVGRTVLTRTLAAGAVETLDLPLAGLAPGIYSVQAQTATGLVAKRLVVQ
ncbi:DUF4394 domain-containing protein [Hymenobacter rubidus]|uniref:DUF4394 domain-containing protein n=1 Tax=Hymenobacter rubidus TaxID=1441626 RepID=UPI00192014FD|nr:DUF4394 domain-containing protein [Hymenobacter rubidus]